MMNNEIKMPASFAAIDENEMVYLQGGATTEATAWAKKFCSLIIVFRLYHQLDLISISPQVDILLEIDNLENIFEGGSR